MDIPPAAAASTAVSPVGAAFAELAAALAAEALRDGADFDRATNFRRHVMDLANRWGEGRPAHGTGARKGSAAP